MKGAARYRVIDKYIVSARLAAPMHIGSAGGGHQDILIHPVTGVPFIQASSIAGALRDYYEKAYGEANAVFGSNSDQTRDTTIKISDGQFTSGDGSMLEFRPRVSIDPDSGTVSKSTVGGTDAQSGHKFDTEYVGKGAELLFSVYICSLEDSDDAVERIEGCLAALNSGEILLGGQKSQGCGIVKVKRLDHRRFDLRDSNDRRSWIDDEPFTRTEGYKNIADRLSEPMNGEAYSIELKARVEGSMLVKGYQVEGFGKDAPDAVNMRNAMKEYIIPGSSVKGAVRSRVEYIVGQIGLDTKAVGEIFGSSSGDSGIAGNARFHDVVVGEIEDNDKNSTSTRIHIDKFTGGVINRALFREKSVAGDVDIRIDVGNKWDSDRAAGLLILALRDLAVGGYNLGGGYHVGKGFLEAHTMTVGHGDNVATIDFSNGTTEDPGGIVERCLNATRREE